VVTARHRIVDVLKILAELGQRIELDLGEWQQLKLHEFKLSLLLIVDKYESPNAVYQRKDTQFS
jgi:hypothetical protein